MFKPRYRRDVWNHENGTRTIDHSSGAFRSRWHPAVKRSRDKRGLEARALERTFLQRISSFLRGPPRVGLRPSGKPELFHSNHSGHTGSIFLNGRSRARVAHWGHKKKKEKRERERDARVGERKRIFRRDRKRGHVSKRPSTRYTLHYSRDTSITYDCKPRSRYQRR